MLTAAVGQVPFNFQIGKDIEAIRLNPPRTSVGELEVRLDGCKGEPIAVLSLARRRQRPVTVLPAVPLSSSRGRTTCVSLSLSARSIDVGDRLVQLTP